MSEVQYLGRRLLGGVHTFPHVCVSEFLVRAPVSPMNKNQQLCHRLTSSQCPWPSLPIKIQIRSPRRCTGAAQQLPAATQKRTGQMQKHTFSSFIMCLSGQQRICFSYKPENYLINVLLKSPSPGFIARLNWEDGASSSNSSSFPSKSVEFSSAQIFTWLSNSFFFLFFFSFWPKSWEDALERRFSLVVNHWLTKWVDFPAKQSQDNWPNCPLVVGSSSANKSS